MREELFRRDREPPPPLPLVDRDDDDDASLPPTGERELPGGLAAAIVARPPQLARALRPPE